jgi:proline racemase
VQAIKLSRDVAGRYGGPVRPPRVPLLPSFTGRAWTTGTAPCLLDPADPFPEGFVL